MKLKTKLTLAVGLAVVLLGGGWLLWTAIKQESRRRTQDRARVDEGLTASLRVPEGSHLRRVEMSGGRTEQSESVGALECGIPPGWTYRRQTRDDEWLELMVAGDWQGTSFHATIFGSRYEAGVSGMSFRKECATMAKSHYGDPTEFLRRYPTDVDLLTAIFEADPEKLEPGSSGEAARRLRTLLRLKPGGAAKRVTRIETGAVTAFVACNLIDDLGAFVCDRAGKCRSVLSFADYADDMSPEMAYEAFMHFVANCRYTDDDPEGRPAPMVRQD